MAAEEGQAQGSSSIKCPECPPPGAPAWMATFSDLVTLLMTFFVLLYATSKQDDHKFESVAGSIRKAFAGNSKKFGDVPQLGKSPDDAPTMIDAQEPVEPFPIDFLTTEGMLDKKEINRDSDENLKMMREKIAYYGLSDSVHIYEMKEGVKIKIKDKIIFKNGSISIEKINAEVFKKVVNLMSENKWKLFIEAHSDVGEQWDRDQRVDALTLSSKRADAVFRSLVRKGVSPNKMTSVFYGDTRPLKNIKNARVEFTLRKIDLKTEGNRVKSW